MCSLAVRLGSCSFIVLPFLALPLSAAKPDWDPVTPAELAETAPKLEPQAAAEMLSYRIDIDDTRDDRRTEVWRQRFKIYDPARAIDITRVARFWNGLANPDHQIEARLTLPDGTSRVFGKSELRTRTVAEIGRANGLLGLIQSRSDWAVDEHFLVVTGVVKGAILDVWEREPGVSRNDWLKTTVQRADTPIRHFEYHSHYTPDPEVARRGYVLNPCGGHMTHDEKAGLVTFVADNLPSIRREPYAAPDSYFALTIIEAFESLRQYAYRRHDSLSFPDKVPASLGPWAFFSTAQDFHDADFGYQTKRVKAKAAELTAGVADPREKLHRIYTFVQGLFQRFHHRADLEDTYTRYVESVDELIDLDKVDSTIISTDDFHYLFVALVRAAGLECHTGLHPLRTAFRFTPALVSDNFLSYRTAIAKVGEEWIICDPCADIPAPLGAIPWRIEGQPALMAASRQQLFLNIPGAPAESSVADVTLNLTLDPAGNLEGDCVRTLSGHYAEDARARLHELPSEEWWRSARELLDLENSSSEVRLTGVDGVDTPDEPVKIRATLRWPAYAAVLGNRMMLAPDAWREGRPPLLNASSRTTPILFPYRGMQTETITIKLPAGYRLGGLPKPMTASSRDFAYSLALQGDAEHGMLTVRRSETNRAIEIPVADYGPVRDWFQRVTVADQTSIFLPRVVEGAAQ